MSKKRKKSRNKKSKVTARRSPSTARASAKTGPSTTRLAQIDPVQIEAAPLAEASFGDDLLEKCRTRWQYGNWDDLIALTQDDISHATGRDKVAMLVAAGHAQTGDMARARHFANLALGWGVSRDIAARVLIGSVHNSLACAAAALDEDEETNEHFVESLRLVEPRADVALLRRTRRIRETTRRGLLPEAARLLEVELDVAQQTPTDTSDRLNILASDIELLKHELAIALSRRQIFHSENSAIEEPLERRAVSQLGQELWVLERLEYKRNGFFVEFGATDGITFSNSWLLETEFGWNGLCAEPNPKFFEKLKKNRSCQLSDACIAGKTGEMVEFILADVYGGIATYADADNHKAKRDAYVAEGHTIHLETISLDDFLTQNNAPPEIDYLSIDTEGSEYDILSAFPFDKWTIRLLTVEHNFTPARQDIRNLLEAQGYTCTEMQFDDWYELAT